MEKKKNVSNKSVTSIDENSNDIEILSIDEIKKELEVIETIANRAIVALLKRSSTKIAFGATCHLSGIDDYNNPLKFNVKSIEDFSFFKGHMYGTTPR